MITIDRDGEESALSRDFDITIPFEYRVNKDDIDITVFPSIKQVAHDFVDTYREKPFSPKAINFVRSKVTEFLADKGYDETPECKKFYREYGIISIAKLNQSVIKSSSEKLIDSSVGNKTTFDIEALKEYGHIAFVTLVDGQVVSIAATHCPFKSTKYIEIGTETAVKYRGNGFAKSNVAALTRFLLLNGKKVIYSCSNTNTKSNKIAEDVGFAEESRHYYYVGRRK